MIRSLIVFVLAGAAFFVAVPALAAEEPTTAPASPVSASAATIRPQNQSANVSAATGSAASSAQAGRNAPQQAGSTTATGTVTSPVTSPVTGLITGTVPITAAASATGSSSLTLTAPLTVTRSLTGTEGSTGAGIALTATAALTTAAPITPGAAVTEPVSATPDPALDEQYAGVLEGTIIANRTEADVRYFVEGQVYDLAPLRAAGLPLPRPTAVLNLFNCDARQSEADAGCFWDPYLLKQDGFYEVVNGDETGALVSLILREAGAPPPNQIWVQNRTGERESLLVAGEPVEIAPASVQQFMLEGTDPVVVHLRNCIVQGAQSACEWAPQSVERGYYYALVKLTTAGANNMNVSTTKLEGIVASSGEVVEQPPQASCLLRVPTLNVRSGPGLEFPVVAKVRGTEEQPGSVVVIGFDASQQWMQVSDRIAQGGWVTSNPDFIICTGDLAALPVAGGAADTTAEAASAAAEATPAPAEDTAAEAAEAPVAAAPVEETTAEEAPAAEAAPAEVPAEAPVAAPVEAPAETTAEAPAEATESAPAAPAVPAGQARITVYNQFDRVIRFTLDQKYRSELTNPTGEWDLEPGQAVSILVFPGMVPYSVSSPWNGLGGNANLNLNPDEDRALYITFIPDPDGSGDWILQSW